MLIKRVMRVGLYLLAAIGALYLAMVRMLFFGKGVCEHSRIADFPSPSLDSAVEVVQVQCRGGTFVTAWLNRPSTASPVGYMQTAVSTSPVPADAGAGGRSPILAVWRSESHVRLVVPRGARKAFERRDIDGVTVTYEER
jgi:hypothetical protein